MFEGGRSMEDYTLVEGIVEEDKQRKKKTEERRGN
jgi:hypothetical protein